MAAACGTRSGGAPEAEKPVANPADSQNEKESPPASVPAQRTESEVHKGDPIKLPPSIPLSGEVLKDYASIKVDWGREATLEEILAMAKNGEIQQIEWHVMPNIIRALVSHDRIFHIRNENKGIDIRNALINAGIPLGKKGIDFRHVF
jgi:hypothetical protein